MSVDVEIAPGAVEILGARNVGDDRCFPAIRSGVLKLGVLDVTGIRGGIGE